MVSLKKINIQELNKDDLINIINIKNEEKKNYFKNWLKTNNKKIICKDCGIEYHFSNKYNHLNSMIHLKSINKIEDYDNNKNKYYYQKNKDKKYICECCNKELNYYSKCIHERTKQHIKNNKKYNNNNMNENIIELNNNNTQTIIIY